jgi:hypothetical protein
MRKLNPQVHRYWYLCSIAFGVYFAIGCISVGPYLDAKRVPEDIVPWLFADPSVGGAVAACLSALTACAIVLFTHQNCREIPTTISLKKMLVMQLSICALFAIVSLAFPLGGSTRTAICISIVFLVIGRIIAELIDRIQLRTAT